jgi:integrase
MPDSRKGRRKKVGSKPIPIGVEIIDVLRPVIVRRAKDDWLLERWRHRQVKGGHWERSERGPWSTSELTRPWNAIRDRAGLPDATPYCLRHSSIVRGIRKNLPIRLVAAAHDTSVQIIERHYSRFIVGDLEKMMAGVVVPLLPEDEGGRVVSMRARSQ